MASQTFACVSLWYIKRHGGWMTIVVLVCGYICGNICGKMCGKIEKNLDQKKIGVVLNMDTMIMKKTKRQKDKKAKRQKGKNAKMQKGKKTKRQKDKKTKRQKSKKTKRQKDKEDKEDLKDNKDQKDKNRGPVGLPRPPQELEQWGHRPPKF